MKHLLKAVGYALAAGILIYFLVYAANVIEEAPLRALLRPAVIVAALGATLLCSTIVPFAGWAWNRLLSTPSHRMNLSGLIAILGVVQLAKYVPGNVAQHLGRVTLSRAYGIPLGAILGSIFVETLFAAAAGLLVGLVALSRSPASAALNAGVVPSPILLACATGLLLTLALMTWPRVSNWIGDQLMKANWTSHRLPVPTRRSVIGAFVAYCAIYLVIGAGFLLLASSIGLGDVGYWHLTATFALAWIAGFLTPGLPAGLGVREGVMAMLLSGSAPPDQALVLIVGMRVVTMAADLLWFVAGAAMLKVGLATAEGS